MTILSESTEEAALDWLATLRWQPGIASDEPAAGRDDYGRVAWERQGHT